MPATIKGKILLPAGQDITFPEGSFLHVTCDDVSMMDAPSTNLGKVVIDVSNKSSKDEICYTLEANVPAPPAVPAPPVEGDDGLVQIIQVQESCGGRRISMSATINVGWERDPNGQEWIRKGDYLNDTTHHLEAKDGEYNTDINVIHYNH